MKIKLAAILFFLSLNLAAKEKIKIYLFDLAPAVIIDERPSGFITELLREVLKNAEIDYEFVQIPGLRAIKKFREGKGLLVGPVGIFKDIQPLFIPFLPAIGGYFGENDVKEVKKVAYRRQIERATGFIKKSGYEGTSVIDFSAALKMLKAKRVDRIMGINLPINYTVKNELPKKFGKIQMIGAPTHRDLLGLLGRSTDQKLFEKIKMAFKESKTNGTFEKAFSKYIKPYLGQFSEKRYRLGK